MVLGYQTPTNSICMSFIVWGIGFMQMYKYLIVIGRIYVYIKQRLEKELAHIIDFVPQLNSCAPQLLFQKQ